MKRKITVLLKIAGGREIEYKEGEDKNFDRLQEVYLDATRNRTGEIVFIGESFDPDTELEKLPTTKGLNTFLKFRIYPVDDPWEILSTWVSDWPELIFKSYSVQIIEMLYYGGANDLVISKILSC